MNNEPSKLYLENQLCFPMYAASRLTTKIYEPFLQELDLTYPQYLVLLVLWKQDQCTVNEIGNQLFLESNTLTPLLKRLEQKKIIYRKRSEEDERKVIITLTSAGIELKNTALQIPEKIIQIFADADFTKEEISDFKNTLHKLVNILHEKLENRNSSF